MPTPRGPACWQSPIPAPRSRRPAPGRPSSRRCPSSPERGEAGSPSERSSGEKSNEDGMKRPERCDGQGTGPVSVNKMRHARQAPSAGGAVATDPCGDGRPRAAAPREDSSLHIGHAHEHRRLGAATAVLGEQNVIGDIDGRMDQPLFVVQVEDEIAQAEIAVDRHVVVFDSWAFSARLGRTALPPPD